MKRLVDIIYRISFAILLISILSLPAFPKDSDVVINAENINYSQDKSFIEIAGSAEVQYKDLDAKSNSFIYIIADKRLIANTAFHLKYGELEFSGDKLDFNLKTRSGSAENVSVNYKSLIMSGKNVEITPSNIELDDSIFTTCNLDRPHYKFASNKIILYPIDGWLLCFNSVIWAGGVPTMPIPVYLYDTKAEEKAQLNIMPYPKVGSDLDQGAFICQSFPWFVSRGLNGDFTIGWAARKGLLGGLDLYYKTNPENEGSFKLNSNAKDPTSLVYEHKHYFGPEIKSTSIDQFSFNFLNPKYVRQYESSFKLSLEEKINYEKVSMLPNISISLKDGKLGSFHLIGGASAGFVSEESSGVGASRVNANLNCSIPLFDSKIGEITPYIKGDETFYGIGTKWSKLSGGIQANKSWFDNVLTTNLGFNHYFICRGTSPYNYELYRFYANDQINAGFMHNLGHTSYGMNVIYNVPSFSPQDIDYLAKIGVHCFNVLFNYRVMRNEFNFSFGIN